MFNSNFDNGKATVILMILCGNQFIGCGNFIEGHNKTAKVSSKSTANEIYAHLPEKPLEFKFSVCVVASIFHATLFVLGFRRFLRISIFDLEI